MTFSKEYFCIPNNCRDQHLQMVPEYAAPFREQGIRGVGIHEVSQPYEIRRLSFPWHMALITISGSAEYEFQGQRKEMQPNQIWVGPADTPHLYRATSDWKFISAALFKANAFAHLEHVCIHRELSSRANHLIGAVEAYLYESAIAETADSTIPRGIADYIAQSIARELLTDEGHRISRARHRLNRLWEEVNADPGTDWRLPMLASRVHVSIRQFQRMMRENYEMTAESMLIRIRMAHARELLTATDFTMAVIAERVGYQSVYAFSKAFKRFYNMPPGAYKKHALQ